MYCDYESSLTRSYFLLDNIDMAIADKVRHQDKGITSSSMLSSIRAAAFTQPGVKHTFESDDVFVAEEGDRLDCGRLSLRFSG